MKIHSLLILFSILFVSCNAQLSNIQTEETTEKELRLIVGITVDQMRYDYLTRYWNDYGEGGFKRMVNSGFSFRNHHFSYAPTFTGPGHASIYTGTTPAVHGIIANDWWERANKKMVYCASDDQVHGIGVEGYSGMMSPRRLRSSTVTDELKLFSSNRSKVIGISLKDRGAILPAGHQPDGAYWFEGKDLGKWITSSWYTEELPEWVENFNSKGLPDSYLSSNWEPLKAMEAYDESTADNTPYEAPFTGTLKPTFPYDLSALRAANGNYELIKATPFGNSLSVDFAEAAIEAEAMGADEFTDFLALSFSSTDYAGHRFGPHAIETQDTYLRLDKDLERFFNYLDKKVGKGHYMVFLTADHGGAPVPSLVHDRGWPNDYFSSAPLVADIDSILKSKYNESLVLNYSNEQIFLDDALILEKGLDKNEIEGLIAQVAVTYPGVVFALTSSQIINGNFTDLPASLIQAGYRQNMSGNVVLLLEPGWMEYGRTGTTHGMPYSYDTHVPLLMFGNGIPQGESFEKSRIRDIAPTISSMLGIPFPSGCTGQPLTPVLE